MLVEEEDTVGGGSSLPWWQLSLSTREGRGSLRHEMMATLSRRSIRHQCSNICVLSMLLRCADLPPYPMLTLPQDF